MLSSFVRSLQPLQRILFFIFLSFLVGSTFGLLATSAMKPLFGVTFPEDYELLSNFELDWVIAANKLLLLTQHLGFFVVPGALFFLLVYSYKKLQFPALNPKIAVVFALGIVLYPAISFLAFLNQMIPLSTELMQMEQQAEEFTMAIVNSKSALQLIGNLILVAVLPAIGEELVFRGIIQHEILRQFKKPWLAIVLASAIFSAMHMQFAGFIPRFALGVLLGYLFYATKSIWYPILLHLANNALALVLVFIEQPTTKNISEAADFQPDKIWMTLVIASFGISIWLLRFIKVEKELPIVLTLEQAADEDAAE